ncbi:nuclear transport factor 2 family protein [Achromobacter aloeverae]
MTDLNDPRLVELMDRSRIADVIHYWCRAIDRLDFDAISRCFHRDGIDDHVFYRGDIPGLVECLRNRHRDISFSAHAVSNILIEFESRTRACVESYVKVTQRRPQPAMEGAEADSHVSEVYCRYLDIFECREGTWAIAHRMLVIDSATEYFDREPVHRLPPITSPNRGRRDGADAVYRRT